MEKANVYNLGPRWQLRGSRYAKKGLPHGIRISSRSHLNFNLADAARTLFGTMAPLPSPFHPSLKDPRVICLPTYLPTQDRCPQVRDGKGCGMTRDLKKKERERKKESASVCPIKNRPLKIGCAYLTRGSAGFQRETHLIRAALKSGARVFLSPRSSPSLRFTLVTPSEDNQRIA